MSATIGYTLSSTDWIKVAVGAGNATFSAESTGVRWAITDVNSPPLFSGGHFAPIGEDVSLSLSAGEHLWLRGFGPAFVTAEVPA